MDSEEDDMYDPYSLDDSSDPETDADTDDSDFCYDDHVVDYTDRRQQNYSILSEEDIHQLQEHDVAEVSNTLSVSRVCSIILLRHFNWNSHKLFDEWFAGEDKVRTTVGLLVNTKDHTPDWLANLTAEWFADEDREESTKDLTCGICFDSYPRQEILENSADCGHPFCSECLTSYITISINDGPGCLMLICPEPSCHIAVGQDIVDKLVSDEDKKKYFSYLARSYIENNKKTKWCPGPGCEYAHHFVGDGSRNYDVCCLCSYCFCWNCRDEMHSPSDCGTVAKWKIKCGLECDNTLWILKNTKHCPKCNRSIQKHRGCMHMTCLLPCKHEFCWLCLGPWKGHGIDYSCNCYKEAEQDNELKEIKEMNEDSKKSLARYIHHYVRWTANHNSRERAVRDLQKMETMHAKKLIETQGQTGSQVKFITEAWQQIIECRRVLKWTYAYGYYLPENERAKKQFFEYLQGEAEFALERLHQCVEDELDIFLTADVLLIQEFKEFQSRLTSLTSVTRGYFENLVKALENGLCDVDFSNACSSKRSSRKGGKDGRGNGRGGRKKGAISRHENEQSIWKDYAWKGN